MKQSMTMTRSYLAQLGWFERLWLGAPIFLWFSYQPLIRFGRDSTMYFELSIALVYLVLLALTGLPVIWRARKALLKHRIALVVGVFVAVGLVSLIWTPNLTRGILTVGILGLLYIVLLASLARQKELRKLIAGLVAVTLVSATIMSLIAIIQIVAGVWLGPEYTLLCKGCVATQFGFARPNAFTIEPQFLGNMLLAPAMIAVYLLIQKNRQPLLLASFGLIVTTLFLTMSRGAIFAFGIGVLILIAVKYRRLRGIVRAGILGVVSFVTCLLIQGTVAAVHPTVEESFFGAVTKSLSQLSLGLIDIQPPEEAVPLPKEQPTYDGYVEESTDVRVGRSRLAIDTWRQSSVVMLGGVGIGGAGVAMHEAFPDEIGAREIVQNEYLEILLENGAVGFVLFVGVLGALILVLWRSKWRWTVAIVVAFAVQWSFFSGYPNTLHIYLVLILLALVATERRVRSAPAKQY